MKLQDFKVSTKLLVTNLVVIAALCLTAGWMELSVTKTLNAATSRVDEVSKVGSMAKEWRGRLDSNTQRGIAMALTDTPSVIQMLKSQSKQSTEAITKLFDGIVALANKPGDSEALAHIGVVRVQIQTALKELARLKVEGDKQAVEQYAETTLQTALQAYKDGLDDFIKLQEAHRAEALAVAAADQSAAEWQGMGLVALIAIASFVWMAMVARAIVRPLRQAVEVADAFAAGDLTKEVSAVASKDELGTLMAALSTMRRNMHKLVSEVRQGVDAVSAASNDIASGNVDLSSRTEQTAANLEETAASMEELTGTIASSAEAAALATKLATSASEAASRGYAVVDDVIVRMNEISESSTRISEIIGTIDSIAFQTNILALNAAVEAARAGEQGRGFAVVASEVRSLAQRSAAAAKEIKELIKASSEKVDAGAEMVAKTGAVMTEIASGIKRATDMMSEISAAANEQRDGISQVNQSVTHLDEMTQQNAALVEQSVAAAAEMHTQAATLASLVATFKVDGVSSVRSQRVESRA